MGSAPYGSNPEEGFDKEQIRLWDAACSWPSIWHAISVQHKLAIINVIGWLLLL